VSDSASRGDARTARLFAEAADAYARFRPQYPPELFQALGEASPGRRVAWDCACGSGQASTGLAGVFERVIATDLYLEPLRRAPRHPAIAYAAAHAESAAVRTGSVDCVAVAQALHWLDLDRFYAEADRVLVPRGLFAAWSYALMRVDPALDPLFDELYYEILAPWWTPARTTVDRGYRSLPFPFDEITLPPITLRVRWTLDELEGHLATWSSVRRARNEGSDPLAPWMARIAPLWGSPEQPRDLRWPLGVRAGRRRSG
jgi:SAM-dependent methyltransferase